MGKSISKKIKEEVIEIVKSFNEREKTSFQMTFRGRFAYLSKVEEDNISNTFMKILADKVGLSLNNTNESKNIIETKIGRLEYTEGMDNWSFAVFRYSKEIYDSEEFMFPGASELNGTIEGALNAGKEIYP